MRIKLYPKLVIINSDIKDKKLIEETLSKKEGNTISYQYSKKRNKSKSGGNG
jgi:excinuclease ABC subunit C